MAVARIALLGAGLIGREHATLVRNHPQTELVGIAVDVTVDGVPFGQQAESLVTIRA